MHDADGDDHDDTHNYEMDKVRAGLAEVCFRILMGFMGSG